jgi:DNA-binding IclR family transcriptional regulator
LTVKPPAASQEAPSSVATALRLLKAFAPRERVAGVSDLARRLGIAKSTAHRLLHLLVAEGFARRTADGRYALGFALWELGTRMIAGLDLRQVAHPTLEWLRNRTQEAVHLAVLDRTEVVYIDRFESPATLQLFRRVGYRMPAYATSSGKAILAFSPPEVVAAVLSGGLKRLAPRTITSKKALLAEFERIRARGYVTTFDESEIGVKSVGAPVLGQDGQPVGAISVAGPSMRFPRARIPAIARLVRQAATEISSNMGYSAVSASSGTER